MAVWEMRQQDGTGRDGLSDDDREGRVSVAAPVLAASQSIHPGMMNHMKRMACIFGLVSPVLVIYSTHKWVCFQMTEHSSMVGH